MSRIDDLARSLAERPSPADVSRVRAQSRDPALDRVARVLAAPLSRRRVFRLAAAAAGTSLFTLPSRAHAQAADDPCPTCADRPGTMPCCRRLGGGLAKVAVGQCYDPKTEECCFGPDPYDGQPTAWICSEGTTCAGSGGCAGRPLCGGTCCPEDEDCHVEDPFSPDSDICAKKCPPGQYTSATAFLKAECLQRGGAFKFRGAYSMISTLPEERAAAASLPTRRATTPRPSRSPPACSGRRNDPHARRHARGQDGGDPGLRRRGRHL